MPPTKRSAGKKSTGSSGRKYGPKASQAVEQEMKEMKQGKLRSGRSGPKVTNPKQAIAIGLSEARREGAKVPPPPGRKKSSAKKGTVKSASKRASAKRTSTKKTSAKSGGTKSSAKKSAAKRGAGRTGRRS